MSPFVTEKLLVEMDPTLYFFVSQGATTVDNMDDNEELRFTDVCMS
jgi:hypothetical protein